MKVLVLLAGCAGVLGFFQPFFDYGERPVSAYRILTGFTAEELGLEPYQKGMLRDYNERIQREPATT